MREKIVAGNWKMNNNATQTKALINDLKASLHNVKTNCRVVIAPTSINLSLAVQETKDSVIEVSAQNMHQEKSGAFTGEISAEMLQSIGIKTVILGHSERRQYFNESDKIVNTKTKLVLENDLKAVVCVGETLEERKAEITNFKDNHQVDVYFSNSKIID